MIVLAAVGNEALRREEISETALGACIPKVKHNIPKYIEVGYVDAYYQFLERPQ